MQFYYLCVLPEWYQFVKESLASLFLGRLSDGRESDFIQATNGCRPAISGCQHGQPRSQIQCRSLENQGKSNPETCSVLGDSGRFLVSGSE